MTLINSIQFCFKKFGSITFLIFYQFFRRSFKQYFSSSITAFRSYVNNMIRHFDHIHIMLDHQAPYYPVPPIYSDTSSKCFISSKCKPGCWFIQYIKGFARISF